MMPPTIQSASAASLAARSDMYSRAFLIRAFEERLLQLFSQGQLFGTVHTCIGQEFTGVALLPYLRAGDEIVSNHRCHGHYLARTGDVNGLMAEVMGRVTGVCGGRGGSQHICAGGVFSNGVQGGMLPIAAGMALAHKLARTGAIVVAFIGDGTLGEGIIYETMNLASLWQLPLLIVEEHNGFAQSTPTTATIAGDVCKRAEAFGIPTYHGNSWDPDALSDLMDTATRQVRENTCPAFARVDTYRLMAHSKGDDDRPKEDVARHWAKDPLVRFEAEWPDEARKMRADAEEAVSQAVNLAATAPFASDLADNCAEPPPLVWQRTRIEGRERVVNRIHEAMRDQLRADGRAFFLGEDIEGPYGGAFKVSKNLSLDYPGRVRNTPISEAAIVGIANGLALAGQRPVCEIMFGDFLTLAADQIINHAAKFRWMYNNQVTVPVVIRTPMGGRRGYGATHSQCLEKHILGLPDTRVLAIHRRYDPYNLYQRLFATIDRPTVVIENKVLYGDYATHETVEGYWCEHTEEDFPTTRICSHSEPDITIVCYGACLSEAEAALDRLFEEHEIVAEIICPTMIYPLRIEPIMESAMRSRRVLVVEEGQLFCGFGAEVIATLSEAAKGIPLVTRRLGPAAHPLPCCKSAELASLPGSDSIVRVCLEMVQNG